MKTMARLLVALTVGAMLASCGPDMQKINAAGDKAEADSTKAEASAQSAEQAAGQADAAARQAENAASGAEDAVKGQRRGIASRGGLLDFGYEVSFRRKFRTSPGTDRREE